MTKEGQYGKNISDVPKSNHPSKHSTSIVPKGRKKEKLPGEKEMGATNIESGTDKVFEEPRRPHPEDIEAFPQDENENCKPERWCHTTFSNEYQARKEEECKETFARWLRQQ